MVGGLSVSQPLVHGLLPVHSLLHAGLQILLSSVLYGMFYNRMFMPPIHWILGLFSPGLK